MERGEAKSSNTFLRTINSIGRANRGCDDLLSTIMRNLNDGQMSQFPKSNHVIRLDITQ